MVENDEFGEVVEQAAVSPTREIRQEGNIMVRCGLFPGDIAEISVPAPATIANAIATYQAGSQQDLSSTEVRLNGELIADLDIPITEGDKIYLSRPKSGA